MAGANVDDWGYFDKIGAEVTIANVYAKGAEVTVANIDITGELK